MTASEDRSACDISMVKNKNKNDSHRNMKLGNQSLFVSIHWEDIAHIRFLCIGPLHISHKVFTDRVLWRNTQNSIDMQIPAWTYSHFHFLSFSPIACICIDISTEHGTNYKENQQIELMFWNSTRALFTVYNLHFKTNTSQQNKRD